MQNFNLRKYKYISGRLVRRKTGVRSRGILKLPAPWEKVKIPRVAKASDLLDVMGLQNVIGNTVLLFFYR